jgi:hypothetical protein
VLSDEWPKGAARDMPGSMAPTSVRIASVASRDEIERGRTPVGRWLDV